MKLTNDQIKKVQSDTGYVFIHHVKPLNRNKEFFTEFADLKTGKTYICDEFKEGHHWMTETIRPLSIC